MALCRYPGVYSPARQRRLKYGECVRGNPCVGTGSTQDPPEASDLFRTDCPVRSVRAPAWHIPPSSIALRGLYLIV